MAILTHVDLFSGIGGFALAAQWAGFTTVAFVEIESYAQEIIKQNFGAVMADAEELHGDDGRIYNRGYFKSSWAFSQLRDNRATTYADIRTFNGYSYRGATLLTGGFPCQPFSQAGKRRGKEDDRYLWPEMLRVIHEARPAWVLGENVAGIINMELDRCISDLEGEGYAVQALVIPACAVDAKHRRDRVWIVAYSERGASGAKRGMAEQLAAQERKGAKTGEAGLQSEGRQAYNYDAKQTGKIVGHANEPGSQRHGGWGEPRCESRWLPEPNVGLLVDGISAGLVRQGEFCQWPEEPEIPRVATGVKNRVDKLKGLGNAIVPKVACEIIRVIALIERS